MPVSSLSSKLRRFAHSRFISDKIPPNPSNGAIAAAAPPAQTRGSLGEQPAKPPTPGPSELVTNTNQGIDLEQAPVQASTAGMTDTAGPGFVGASHSSPDTSVTDHTHIRANTHLSGPTTMILQPKLASNFLRFKWQLWSNPLAQLSTVCITP